MTKTHAILDLAPDETDALEGLHEQARQLDGYLHVEVRTVDDEAVSESDRA